MLALWHPEPNHKANSEQLTLADKTEGIISHHEVLHRLEAFDTDRGRCRACVLGKGHADSRDRS